MNWLLFNTKNEVRGQQTLKIGPIVFVVPLLNADIYYAPFWP